MQYDSIIQNIMMGTSKPASHENKYWKETHSLYESSIFSTYLLVPIMSSRYSRKPSSCGPCAFGFMSEICSTSPYQYQKFTNVPKNLYNRNILNKGRGKDDNLKNQEPIIIQVDPLFSQFPCNLREITSLFIDKILWRVITESYPSYWKFTARNNFIFSIILQTRNKFKRSALDKAHSTGYITPRKL